jgi:hypothetical protein
MLFELLAIVCAGIPPAADAQGRLGGATEDHNIGEAPTRLHAHFSQPCYAPASLVLVRPSGETLAFSCADHLPAWASRIQGRYLVLEREEWKAWGAGYRGPALGG